MHSQLLLDNTRPNLQSRKVARRLAADLLHSALFHADIAYLDSYIMNNIAFRFVMRKIPVVSQLMQQPFCYVFCDNRFASHEERMISNAENKRFGHLFGSATNYLADMKSVVALLNGIRPIPYIYDDARIDFTTTLLALLRSSYAQRRLGQASGRLAIHLENYLAETDRKFALQSDFEGARTTSHFAEYLCKADPTFTYNALEGKFIELEQFAYRSTIISGRSVSHIMPPSHTKSYREIHHEQTRLTLKEILISSPYLNTFNMLNLEIDDILSLRSTDEFKCHVQAITATPPNYERTLNSLSNYVFKIEDLLKIKAPKRNLIAVQGAQKVLGISLAISSNMTEDRSGQIQILLNIRDLIEKFDPDIPGVGPWSPAIVQCARCVPTFQLAAAIRLSSMAQRLKAITVGDEIDTSSFVGNGQYDTGFIG